MMSNVDRLVTLVHSGVFETPYWKGFLSDLQPVLDADYCSLILRRADASLSELTLLLPAGASADPQIDYLEQLHRRSYFPYLNLVPERVYTRDEALDALNEVHADFRTYLAGRAFNFARVIRFTEPRGGNAWLTVGRKDADLTAEAVEVMRQLAPHLSIAVRTLGQIELEKMRARVAADAVKRLNFAWLLLDAAGRVIDVDPDAAALFESIPGLRSVASNEVLKLPDKPTAMLRETLASFKSDPRAGPRAIHLTDEPWLDMLVVPSIYRPVSGGATPVAALYVHGETSATTTRQQQLMSLFRLTRREAALAIALSRGRSIVEAAADLGLTEATARNYSKRIYAKTDTRGAADLVRLVLTSVIALT